MRPCSPAELNRYITNDRTKQPFRWLLAANVRNVGSPGDEFAPELLKREALTTLAINCLGCLTVASAGSELLFVIFFRSYVATSIPFFVSLKVVFIDTLCWLGFLATIWL